jgi:hypothetical protein
MAEPKVRSVYMKQFASRVLLLGTRGEAVVAADPGLFEEIEAASRLSWLPAELNVRMIHALVEGLGAQGCHDFQGEQIAAQLSTPLWRGFVEGGIRTLGLDPASLARWLPNALGLIFKDCGRWSVEDLAENGAALDARELPVELIASPRWVESIAGGVHALFIMCQTSGETKVARFDRDAGSARIELRWKPVAR